MTPVYKRVCGVTLVEEALIPNEVKDFFYDMTIRVDDKVWFPLVEDLFNRLRDDSY